VRRILTTLLELLWPHSLHRHGLLRLIHVVLLLVVHHLLGLLLIQILRVCLGHLPSLVLHVAWLLRLLEHLNRLYHRHRLGLVNSVDLLAHIALIIVSLIEVAALKVVTLVALRIALILILLRHRVNLFFQFLLTVGVRTSVCVGTISLLEEFAQLSFVIAA